LKGLKDKIENQITIPFTGGDIDSLASFGPDNTSQTGGRGGFDDENSGRPVAPLVEDNTVFSGRLDFLSMDSGKPCVWTVGRKATKFYLANEARKIVEERLDEYKGKRIKLVFFEPERSDYAIVTFPGLKRKFFGK
jgi:hypothetical protein